MKLVEGVFTGDDCNRPAETVGSRLRWAFGHRIYNPRVEEVDLERVDYIGQTPGAVIGDCLDAMIEAGPRR